MKKIVTTLLVVVFLGAFAAPVLAATAQKAPQPVRAKFYDFSDQLIDGEVKKPTALYTDARQKVRFDRLMRLRKSFLEPLKETAKQRVFK